MGPAVDGDGRYFEAVRHDMCARLMRELAVWIQSKGLTQQRAGQILGVGQSRVSHLVRGNSRLFSLDMLVLFALRAGLQPRLLLAAPPSIAPYEESAGDPVIERAAGANANAVREKCIRIPSEAAMALTVRQETP